MTELDVASHDATTFETAPTRYIEGRGRHSSATSGPSSDARPRLHEPRRVPTRSDALDPREL